ncbi:hypothetical protein BJ170DRAFT_182077 [Xylariales sp. AK1849]|nr:hypothetical protein BJ170DRAFT_182077 [Xylariales sp. AK1849]
MFPSLTRHSKRMYNHRFRQWNISKYLRVDDKRDILKNCRGSIKLLTEQRNRGNISEQVYKKTVRWYRSTQPIYPSRSMSPDPGILNPEIIMCSIRDYHHWLAKELGQPASRRTIDPQVLEIEPSSASNEFWYGFILGVKSLASSEASVEEIHQGYSTLREVGKLAAPAMTSRPLDFICSLFLELSPNYAQTWPQIRIIVLRLLGQEASRVLSPSHPIAVVCRELQKHENSTGITRAGLECMLGLARQLWGERHVLPFKIREFMFITELRVRDANAAKAIATELLLSSQDIWGHGSQQARTAEQRLAQAHLFKSQWSVTGLDRGALETALRHYDLVLRRPLSVRSAADASDIYEDETSISTMADIAFIHEKLRDLEKAVVWLEEAVSIATRVCGPRSNITKVAVNVLAARLREMGRDEEARTWELTIGQTESAS